MKSKWLDQPEDHDYPAAANYLSLVLPPPHALALAESLKQGELVRFKAKDLLRASRLPLLSKGNKYVQNNLKKVAKGERLSPVLLVRGSIEQDRPLTVADGYHRVCASYFIDENTEIPCRIVDWA
ncbi:MAG: hypothetical protein WCL17_04410 [Actinomycetota bacterium]|jgi:hypothetical protein